MRGALTLSCLLMRCVLLTSFVPISIMTTSLEEGVFGHD